MPGVECWPRMFQPPPKCCAVLLLVRSYCSHSALSYPERSDELPLLSRLFPIGAAVTLVRSDAGPFVPQGELKPGLYKPGDVKSPLQKRGPLEVPTG